MLLVAGITNTFPVFLPALLTEFGSSRAATASTASLLWVGGALLSPVAGYLVTRWNPRRLVSLGLGLAALGMLLGDAKINIATFHLGREGEGQDAIALVGVDQVVPDDVLAKIKALPQVRYAKVLRF